MKFEDAGLKFCYRIKTKDGRIYYVIARSLNKAAMLAERRFPKEITTVEYLGEGI